MNLLGCAPVFVIVNGADWPGAGMITRVGEGIPSANTGPASDAAIKKNKMGRRAMGMSADDGVARRPYPD